LSVVYEALSGRRQIRREGKDRVIAIAGWAGAGGKEHPAIGSKRETTREGHDARQDCFARPEQTGREGHDCSRRSRSDIVATVRSEIASAGVEVGDRTSFGGDAPMWIEREDAIVAIVHVDSVPVRMDAKPARVGDTAKGAERAEHFAIEGEGQYRAITGAIGSSGAGHENIHGVSVPRPDA
jgi:hypothetical protein